MNNLPINRTIIKKKAVTYAQELQVEEFHYPNGWFDRWKARYKKQQTKRDEFLTSF